MNIEYAHELVNMPEHEVLELGLNSDEEFLLEFDDEQIVTNWAEVLVTYPFWEYHRQYNDLHLPSSLFVGDNFLSPTLQAKLSKIGLDCVEARYPDIDQNELTKVAYDISNFIHNQAVGELEEYVDSLSALDFLQVEMHPEIQQAKAEFAANPTKRMVKVTYERCNDILLRHPDFRDNALQRSGANGGIKVKQWQQISVLRGYTAEINQAIFVNAIPCGYAESMKRLSFIAMDSRGGSSALMATEDPVRKVEYYNREMQLLTYGIHTIDKHDCGSTDTMPWLIREHDLQGPLLGKYFVKDDGSLDVITRNRHELVGQTLELRNVKNCWHTESGVICQYCLGRVGKRFQRGVNVGYQSTVTDNEGKSQKVISTKHHLMSADGETLDIAEEYKWIFTNDADPSEVSLTTEFWKNDNIRMVINSTDFARLMDVVAAPSMDIVKKMDPASLSRIGDMQIHYRKRGQKEDEEPIYVALYQGSYFPYLSPELLEYIRENSYAAHGSQAIEINLSQWPNGETLLRYPDRQGSALEAAEELKALLFCVGDKGKKAKTTKFARLHYDLEDPMLLAESLREILDKSNERFYTTLPILELVMLSTMVRDPKRDFRLPRRGTGAWYARQSDIMANRSLSVKMAYEYQFESRVRPTSYSQAARDDLPFDILLTNLGGE